MEKMDFLIIYDHPTDYPDHFVVRRHELQCGGGGKPEPTNDVWLTKTLPEARDTVLFQYPNLVRVPRHPKDDPKIIEVWF
jgi:hypothetical protein